MIGYQENFLGNGELVVPLPGFGPTLAGDIFRDDALEESLYATYPNYSVVMNRRRRSPAYVALNIDQKKIRTVEGATNWRVDTRVGEQFQLNNDYYEHNPWDRGHMARRASAAWGKDEFEATIASEETYYWTNAVLQHKAINRDEWLGIEDWVRNLEQDDSDRISVISGPVFAEVSRSVQPIGRDAAAIPTAFFKVVLFRHVDAPDKLAVRAFILPQDVEGMRDQRGWAPDSLQKYQASVRQIEQLTGLVFDQRIVDANPLFFTPSAEAERLGVSVFPELNEVDVPEDIIDPGNPRATIRDREVDVVILASLINPSGPEREGEWVSIANLTNAPVSLAGWELRDSMRRVCMLDGEIGPGEARRIQPIANMMLANRRAGSISLWNEIGERIDRVRYSVDEAKQQEETVIFYDPRRNVVIPNEPPVGDQNPET